MELATRMFDSIVFKKYNILHKAFKEIPELSAKPLAKARTLVRLAALLHDIGHIFFSHSAEKLVLSGKTHEWLSEIIIRKENLLGGLLKSLYGADISGLIADIISEKITTRIPQLTFLSDIISGSMDADRTDYLIRDSLHCGVDYGRFDFRRLIECLELEKTEDGKLKIAIGEDGLQSFEALILARYQINTQVYHHRIRSLYDQLLRNYISAKDFEIPVIENEEEEKILSLLKLNDINILSEIFQDAESNKSSEVKKWAKHIAERHIFRIVLDTGFELDDNKRKKFKALAEDLHDKYNDIEFITIIPDVSIHSLWTQDVSDDKSRSPDERDDESKSFDWMKVIYKSGNKEPVGEKSLILKKIQRGFRYGRIFIDLPKEDKKLKSIKKYTEKKWKNLTGG